MIHQQTRHETLRPVPAFALLVVVLVPTSSAKMQCIHSQHLPTIIIGKEVMQIHAEHGDACTRIITIKREFLMIHTETSHPNKWSMGSPNLDEPCHELSVGYPQDHFVSPSRNSWMSCNCNCICRHMASNDNPHYQLESCNGRVKRKQPL